MKATDSFAMFFKKAKFKTLCLTLLSAATLSACVTTSYDSSQTPGLTDPFESFNRRIFSFNKVIDNAIIHPILEGYRYAVPAPARTGIDNALTNLQRPAHVVNSLLQGDIKGAGDALFAGIVNTFVGFGGLLDVASYEGYNAKGEDFGQTLAVWGVSHGPYVVIPVLGAASARDGIGIFVDSYADPTYWYSQNTNRDYLRYNKAFADYANLRNNLMDALKDLERSSIDYYASVRSSYYQARQRAINNGEASNAQDIADFDEY